MLAPSFRLLAFCQRGSNGYHRPRRTSPEDRSARVPPRQWQRCPFSQYGWLLHTSLCAWWRHIESEYCLDAERRLILFQATHRFRQAWRSPTIGPSRRSHFWRNSSAWSSIFWSLPWCWAVVDAEGFFRLLAEWKNCARSCVVPTNSVGVGKTPRLVGNLPQKLLIKKRLPARYIFYWDMKVYNFDRDIFQNGMCYDTRYWFRRRSETHILIHTRDICWKRCDVQSQRELINLNTNATALTGN